VSRDDTAHATCVRDVTAGRRVRADRVRDRAPGRTAWPPDRLNNLTEWGIYRGDKGATQYSSISQINTTNVHRLKVAWQYNHGFPEGPGIYSNAIVVDGLLYFTTPRVNVIALDAATGKQVWRFDPAPYNGGRIFRGRNRGVTYWEDEHGRNQRIFAFVRDRVYAIDAKTGALIEPFGQVGGQFIDLKRDLPVPPELADIEVTTPGTVFENYLIVTSRVPEGNTSTPGDIRAYNAATGKFEWIFNTIPRKGQVGYDTWAFEPNMHYGGANVWGGVTVDEQRGWVFAAPGSAAGEFIYGGSRKGDNLFANTVLALNARTGERIWHYQIIRHDIWDYDLPPAPILATITTKNGTRDVVVQLTKMGLTFVLDRDTGKPVFPVVDLPVPPSTVPGEQASATQPFPLLPQPLTRLQMHESDITDITPKARAHVLQRFRQHQSGFLYTPATLGGVVTMPGHLGGAEWHGGAFDPTTNVLFVNVNELPTIHSLRPLEPDNLSGDMTPVQRGARIYDMNCTACHGPNRIGNLPLLPPLTDVKLSRDGIREVLTNGRGTMPSFSRLSEAEMNDVIAYLQSDPSAPSSAPAAPRPDRRTGVPTWSGGKGPWAWSTTTPQYANMAPFFVDDRGYPAIKPPWGTLNALDLATGRLLWKVPLGEYPALAAEGIGNTGSLNMGGAVATAGNLVFIGATVDEKFRAFDKYTGRILWEYQLPAGGYATPSVYTINGKQYVVIAAGGAAKPETRPGDAIIAFALPD
jgi:glucose dehydrogenase